MWRVAICDTPCFYACALGCAMRNPYWVMVVFRRKGRQGSSGGRMEENLENSVVFSVDSGEVSEYIIV